VKYLSLIAHVDLIVSGLMAFSTDAACLKELLITNLGSPIIWSYW
jgi:hypothetical protein